ncbi:NAD(+) diphosphatase [Phyllobacterium zundukense]|uniref:NAD(+) diphosphatase n=1 Tax=Phyllobacterium zundukense TaxID=1867719 RepID=A0A2N9VSG4_9HYPH|nr:NAD(+) diphosphatase [Phyllobacterium zundukense]ATU92850.1 NADH pyrophosphatase [Phyllobacterium zundukense]PIO42432.1 NADH pyrophosphatase [Phyllobacterium zundukense]
MSFRLFDVPETEASHFVGFAGNRINRHSEKRSDDVVTLALANANARMLLIGQGQVLVTQGDTGNALFGLDKAAALLPAPNKTIYLGMQDDMPILASPSGFDFNALPEAIKAIDYRSVYTQGLIPPDQLGAMAQAVSLLTWHENHTFCGRCGTETVMRDGGYRRTCPNCEAQHFPRTDPVAIMMVVRGDKCLLARGAHFGPGMYSCLAGFIEPGETIENAVRRETLEETNLPVGRVLYHASQPWPFPYSLMIGCHAEALSDDFTLDRAELEDGRWFSREEVATMLDRTHADGLMTPPPGAIAAHLIRSWVDSGV